MGRVLSVAVVFGILALTAVACGTATGGGDEDLDRDPPTRALDSNKLPLMVSIGFSINQK